MITNKKIARKFEKYKKEIIDAIGDSEYAVIAKDGLSRTEAVKISRLIAEIEQSTTMAAATAQEEK